MKSKKKAKKRTWSFQQSSPWAEQTGFQLLPPWWVSGKWKLRGILQSHAEEVLRVHCAPSHPEGALCVSICKSRPYVNDLLTNLKAKSTCYKPQLLPFFCALCYCLYKPHNFRKCQVQLLYQDANCGKSAWTFMRKSLGENGMYWNQDKNNV